VDVATLFGGYRGRVDLLVTSPPYATALPYLDTDRLSLIVLGLLPHKEHRNVEAYMVGTREVTESERTASWKEYCRRKKELPRNIQTLIDSIADANHGDGVGFRRRNLPALLGRYFLSMRDAMRSALVLMKPGARAFYVVGNNSTEVQGTKVDIPTDMLLFEIAATVGWKQEELINMELLPSRDIFRENRGSKETILCLRA